MFKHLKTAPYICVAIAILTLFQIEYAEAHAKGEDYIFTDILDQSIEGNFEININDLRSKLELDVPADKKLRADFLQDTEHLVHAYILDNFSIGPVDGEPYEIEFLPMEKRTDDIEFARYGFRINTGPMPDSLSVTHTLFYEFDRFHRGLFLIDYNAKTDRDYGEEYTALVFSPGNNTQVIDLTDVPGLLDPMQMIWQGMLHIWVGLDHVLFLVSLVLSTVLIRRQGAWQPLDRFRPALFNLLSIVTVFTLAHSVSLFLSAFDIVQLNSQFVESMIALSIILVACNNIFVWIRRGSLWVILFLGLFHGLGFASVLGNLPFRMVDVVTMVLMFNIGVELGQIVIVGLLFPILYYVRKRSFYVPWVLHGGSILLIAVALVWLVQRVFSLG